MAELTVRDAMHEGVVSCSPDASLEEVAGLMRERGITGIVVVKDAVAVGVISQTDLVNAAFVQPYLRYWRGMAAHHLMSSPVVAVRPDAPLADAIEILRSRKIHRLVVTEAAETGERPVGILSTTDIARVLGDHAMGAEPARSDIY